MFAFECRAGRIAILCFLALLGTTPASATNVSGPINANTTWNLAGSPYVVVGVVTINAGVTLTIEPGVQVQIPNNYNLTILGTLNANAVSFTGTYSANLLVNNGAVASLTGCTFGGSSASVLNYYAGSSGTISGCSGAGGWQLTLNSSGVTVGSGLQLGSLNLNVPLTVSNANLTGNLSVSAAGTLQNCTVAGTGTITAAAHFQGGTITGNVSLSAAATIQNATLGSLELASTAASGATVTGCTIGSTTPIRIDDPDTIVSGISGNIYTGSTPYILMKGTLNLSNTVGILDGLGRYRVNGNIVVSPGAVWTLSPGVELQRDSSSYTLVVNGTLNASGVAFTGTYSADCTINTGATANFKTCSFAGGASGTLTYNTGSVGQLSGCTGAGGWKLVVNSDGVTLGSGMQVGYLTLNAPVGVSGAAITTILTVTAPATLQNCTVNISTTISAAATIEGGAFANSVTLSAAATIQNATLGSLVLSSLGASGAVVTGCTFTSSTPITLSDPDIDISGFSGNTFTGSTPYILIGGTLEGNKTLTNIGGLSRYRLSGALTVAPGATLTIAPGVELQNNGALFTVNGSLSATGAVFTGNNSANFTINAGAQADFVNCSFPGSVASNLVYAVGSRGTFSGCTGANSVSLAVNSSDVTVENAVQLYTLTLNAPITVNGANVKSNLAVNAPAGLRNCVVLGAATVTAAADIQGGSISSALKLSAPAMIRNVVLSSVELTSAGATGAIVNGCTLTSSTPIQIDDPDLDYSGIAGNVYTGSSPAVLFSGTLDGNLTLSALDGLNRFGLNANLTVAPGAVLTMQPGVIWGNTGSATLTVNGTLNAVSIASGGFPTTFNCIVNSGATANFTDCIFTGGSTYAMTYNAGSLGAIHGCTGSTNWQLTLNSSSVTLGDDLHVNSLTLNVPITVNAASIGNSLVVSAAATLQNCTVSGSTTLSAAANVLGGTYSGGVLVSAPANIQNARLAFVEITAAAASGATVSGCTLTSSTPIRVDDLDYDFSGVSGNSYTGNFPAIQIGGTLNGNKVLAPLDGIGRYLLNTPLTVAAGGNLTMQPGIEFDNEVRNVTINGTFNANGVLFTDGWSSTFDVNSGGTANFINCPFSGPVPGPIITYNAGSLGTISGCTGTNGWKLVISSSAVQVGSGMQVGSLTLNAPVTVSGATVTANLTVTAAASIQGGAVAGNVNVSAAATLQGVSMGSLQVSTAGTAGVTVSGCTLTSSTPLRFDDPDAIVSGIAGNTYTSSSPYIQIGGTVNGSVTLGALDGLHRYSLIGDLTVAAGATLWLAPGIEFQHASAAALTVNGTLLASAVQFTGDYSAKCAVNAAASAQFSGCSFAGSGNGVLSYAVGSGGALHDCTGAGGWGLAISSDGVSVGGGMQVGSLTLNVPLTVGGATITANLVVTAAATLLNCTVWGPATISGAAHLQGGTITGNVNVSAPAVIQFEELGALQLSPGASGVAVSGCTISSSTPIRIDDPGLDTSGIAGNQYPAALPFILIDGELTGSAALGIIDGISRYRMGGPLTIEPGATLSLQPGIEYENSTGASLTVFGTLIVNSVTFTGAYSPSCMVYDGATARFTDSVMTSGGMLLLAANSHGYFRFCTLRSLSVHSSTALDAVWNDLSHGAVTVSGNSSATINLQNNYWGTTDTNVIDAKITDHKDNSNLPTVAYEPLSGPLCAGDLNGDLTVDLSDLVLLLANYGCGGPSPCAGDANADGIVDLSDLALLLVKYGSVCS